MPELSRVVQAVDPAMSIRCNTLVYELKRRGERVYVLSLGESFFDVPLFDFSALPFPALYHYSHSRGILEIRSLIREYYEREYQVQMEPESELLVTAGSKAAIYMAFRCILDAGDEVLIPEPAWVSYTEQVKLCCGVPVGVPYTVDCSEFEQFITEKTRAIVLTNPHNPRGYVYSRSELERLVELARERDLWLLCDEPYSEFVEDGSFVSLGAVDPRKEVSVVFNSFSKNFGMSGWRIGYAIAQPRLIDQMLKVNQHLITCPATALLYYTVRYFDRILEFTRPQIRAVVEKRAAIAEYIEKLGLRALRGNATFYFFLCIAPTKLGSEEFCTRLLQEDRICVVPGIGYGESCDQFVRLSIGTESFEDIQYCLEKIKDLIERTS